MTSESGNPGQDGQGKDSESTEPEGTIPNSEDGVGLTSTDEPNNFEPEEDPDAEEA